MKTLHLIALIVIIGVVVNAKKRHHVKLGSDSTDVDKDYKTETSNNAGVNTDMIRPVEDKATKLTVVGSHTVKQKQRGRDETKPQRKRNERRKQRLHVANVSTLESDYKACKGFICKQDEMCIVNLVTKEPECTSKPSPVEKIKPSGNHNGKTHREGHAHFETAGAKSEDIKSRARLMKEQAKDFEQQYRQNQKNKLHQTTLNTDQSDNNNNNNNNDDKKDKKNDDLQRVNLKKSGNHHSNSADCSQSEFDVVADELLNYFKEKQDETTVGQHKRAKRNSTKKELHEDDECMCQAPVSWQFAYLDASGDVKLSQAEVRKTVDHLPKNQRHCAERFYESCDRNKDSLLSEKEWCCCFAHVLPPCLAAQRNVPHMLVHGEPVRLGDVFVPECDSDGFFSRVQCRRATGECWCVDRKGNQVKDTVTVGTPNCN